MELKKTFLLSMIGSLSLSALIGIIIFLFGEFFGIQGKILLSTLTLAGTSLIGLCCSLLYEKNGKYKLLALGGICTTIIGFIWTITLIWTFSFSHDFELLFKGFFILLIISFSIAHSSLLLIINSNEKIVRKVLFTTLIFISIVAAMLIILVFFDVDFDFYYRLLGVFAILDVLGTLTTPILNKFYYK
jgi:hypothetical protein